MNINLSLILNILINNFVYMQFIFICEILNFIKIKSSFINPLSFPFSGAPHLNMAKKIL